MLAWMAHLEHLAQSPVALAGLQPCRAQLVTC